MCAVLAIQHCRDINRSPGFHVTLSVSADIKTRIIKRHRLCSVSRKMFYASAAFEFRYESEDFQHCIQVMQKWNAIDLAPSSNNETFPWIWHLHAVVLAADNNRSTNLTAASDMRPSTFGNIRQKKQSEGDA